jgi:hypothetical protein
MPYKDPDYDKKKYDISRLLLGIVVIIVSIFLFLANTTFINPFVEIKGNVAFATATIKIEKRSSKRGSYNVKVSELTFAISGDKHQFILEKDIPMYSESDEEDSRLAERLRKCNWVVVTIRSFNINEDEPRVLGLNIDGRDVLYAKTTQQNEALLPLALFFGGIVLLLYGLKIFEY